jgi:hypothetical protein
VERIDEVLVAFVVRRYDDEGRPVDERTVSGPNGQPVKLFRASCPDVWGWIDEQMAKGAES